MPRKHSQRTPVLRQSVPRDRGRCAECWRFVPVTDAGLLAVHQVRAAYHGDLVPLIDCPGAGQRPAGRVVHHEPSPYKDRR